MLVYCGPVADFKLCGRICTGKNDREPDVVFYLSFPCAASAFGDSGLCAAWYFTASA